MMFGTHLALDNSNHVLDGGPNPPTEGELAPVKVVRAQKLRTARPVNKNYRLLNILRNADVNKVGRPPSAVAELLYYIAAAVTWYRVHVPGPHNF